MLIKITVNGEPQEVATDTTLSMLIKALGLDPKTVAALLNDEIVPRDRFEAVHLGAGDMLELVRFVPGG